MERLTVKRKDGRWAIANNDGASPMTQMEKIPIAINRLTAYEDIGLEPEEIKNFLKCWCAAAECGGFTPPPNTPLTLEELREMDLFEWLWVEVIHPTKRHVFRKIESAYYQVFEDYTSLEALCCGWPGLIHEFEYMDYGKTWLAYRRKPEEGTTNYEMELRT